MNSGTGSLIPSVALAAGRRIRLQSGAAPGWGAGGSAGGDEQDRRDLLPPEREQSAR
ncbi:hypothetical protein [Actinomadura macrotermitis]|uniref:hypothetical protein n=1 Tax=Actinomadura macrotermitis TaxID=2585200 RepID=UPI001296A140|nr:hypothetical protein [Actinomadura macrotermitis]